MEVEVLNMKANHSVKGVIGARQVVISKMIKIDKGPQDIVIDLVHNTVQKGKLSMRAVLSSPNAANVDNKIDEKLDSNPQNNDNDTKKDSNGASKKDSDQIFTRGVLSIKKIVCKDLPNVEMLMGKDDPFVVVEFNNTEFKTEVLEEEGSNPIFDFLDMKFDVESDDLDFQEMKIQVFDANKQRSHTSIGNELTLTQYFLFYSI